MNTLAKFPQNPTKQIRVEVPSTDNNITKKQLVLVRPIGPESGASF